MPCIAPLRWVAVFCVVVTVLLTGCLPDDGKRGPAGPAGPTGEQGPPGPPGTGPATLWNHAQVSIHEASINRQGHPVVRFSLQVDGVAHDRLGQAGGGSAAFTLAKLAPRTRYAEGYDWQNYINRPRDVRNFNSRHIDAPVFANAIQGNTEAITAGTLENLGNGMYRYTFNLNVNAAHYTIPGLGQMLRCIPNGAVDGRNDLCWWPDGTALPSGVRIEGDTFMVDYAPALTHRVAMQLGGGLPTGNAWLDFVPNGSPVRVTQDIVTVASCNSCHDTLAKHGNTRVETQMCVTCHNPGSVDPVSGRSIDFKQMVHKIHRGMTLPSVTEGVPYFLRNGQDFSAVRFPQAVHEGGADAFGIGNCVKCHMGPDSAAALRELAGNNQSIVDRLQLARVTPNGDLWRQRSVEACSSCHDDVYWWEGQSADSLPGLLASRFNARSDGPLGDWRSRVHAGGTSQDGTWASCATGGCHGSTTTDLASVAHTLGDKGSNHIHRAHLGITRGAIRSETLETQIASANLDRATGQIAVRMRVWDRAHQQALIHGPQGNANFALSFVVGWMEEGFADYTHSAQPGRPGRAAEVGGPVGGWGAYSPDEQGYYTVTLQLDAAARAALPARATGTVATQNIVTVTQGAWENEPPSGPGGVILRNASFAFPIGITMAELRPRRQVVDFDLTCRSCHIRLAKHGGNRRNSPELCVMCHNPNNTDITHAARRGSLGGYDGKYEESKDMMTMIHAIHGRSSLVDGEVRSQGLQLRAVAFGADFEGLKAGDIEGISTSLRSRFSGRLSDCSNCHVNDSFQLPVGRNAPGKIIGTSTHTHPNMGSCNFEGADATNCNLEQLEQHRKQSPTMSVCTSCHDTNLARQHIVQMGGSDMASIHQLDPMGEMCTVCHGEGRAHDMKVVHRIP